MSHNWSKTSGTYDDEPFEMFVLTCSQQIETCNFNTVSEYLWKRIVTNYTNKEIK